jgi:hypothetical protein
MRTLRIILPYALLTIALALFLAGLILGQTDGAVVLLMLIFALFAVGLIARVPTEAAMAHGGFRFDRGIVLACLTGAMLTHLLIAVLQSPPVLAAAGTALAAALLLRWLRPDAQARLSTALYAGCFVGTTAPDVAGSVWVVLGASVIAGVLYTGILPVFAGIGGKLGAIALISVTIALLVSRL